MGPSQGWQGHTAGRDTGLAGMEGWAFGFVRAHDLAGEIHESPQLVVVAGRVDGEHDGCGTGAEGEAGAA